jgi:phospholipid-transporting ATPase
MDAKENKVITSKYTALTFFPLNIYHQLSKPANIFFVFTLILLCIPTISPFNPFVYLVAVSIVIGMSMTKDGIEDYKRHKHDAEINGRPTHVIRREGGPLCIEEVRVEDLSAGDFVIIYKDQEVPADVVLLTGKVNTKNGVECKNYCFIETSNLDGEGNLKKRTSQHYVPCASSGGHIRSMCTCDRMYVEQIRSHTVEDTGVVFNKFECVLDVDGQNVYCNEKNVLLRSSRIKNTERVLGLVVSVGKDTKLGRSQLKPQTKSSLFERELNVFIFWIFLIYLLVLLITAIFGSIALKDGDNGYLYLDPYLSKESLRQTGASYILYSYLIPLSLFVTLEITRIFHSGFVAYDDDMKVGDTSSVCRNSNVTEDIGMVDYVLSDKTGTITKNSMVFRYCHTFDSNEMIPQEELKGLETSITDLGEQCHRIGRGRNAVRESPRSGSSRSKGAGGIVRETKEKIPSDDMEEGDADIDKREREYHKLLFVLALLTCNSVEPLNGRLEGISQDELCILEELKKYGYILVERDERYVVIEVGNVRVRCCIEMSLDFTSARQRMSVVLRIFDRYFLFSKGSDQKLMHEKRMRVKNNQQRRIQRIIKNNSGFRSLVVGYRELSREQFKKSKYEFRRVSLKHRLSEQEKIFDKIEDRMEYLGTTFIEDELQDEVRETTAALKRAGIKIWMVTGDKKETAVSCAKDSGIMDGDESLSLVARGEDFMDRLDDERTFQYRAIVIFRATPNQKGNIAKKMVDLGKSTLSIGDGNNDVAMLTNSSIGVGIIGNEGTQASLSADFAIPEFRLLRRLMMIHGRYNLIRFSKITLNAFFKNIFFIAVQFFYNCFTRFSGKPVYNDFFLNYFNVIFTSFVPISIGLFDKDRPEEHCLRHPEEYRGARLFFSRFSFLAWFVYAVLGGVVVFVLSLGVIYKKELVGKSGLVGGYLATNNFISIVVFWVVLWTQIMLISFFVVYSWIAIFLSILFNFLTLFFIQEISVNVHAAAYNLFSMPVFYMTCLFVLSATVLLDSVMKDALKFLRKRKIQGERG